MKTYSATLAGLFAAALLSAAMTARAADAPVTVTLKDAYKDHFLVGAAINRGIATGAGGRRTSELIERDIALVKEQFNQITAENDMKWQLIHPREGADGYDFAPADAFVNFGLAHKMYIAGHTLVWHSQTPNWVFAGTNPPPAVTNATPGPGADAAGARTNAPGRGGGGGGFAGGFGRGFTGPRATREELLQRMRDHIHTVVGRYKGKIKTWDVVNEAIADGGGTNILRNSLWLQIIGPDYIARAFQYAHEADPAAILRYNDYGLENSVKRQKLVTLIKSLREQNVPVHAIGSQAHVNISTTFETMDQALTEMAALGLPIHITELDVNTAAGGQRGTGADVAGNASATQGGQVNEADRRQAGAYEGIFKAFLKHRNSVKVVTFWGVNDAVSWRRAGNPLLFDGNNQPKPAFEAVIRAATGLESKGATPQVRLDRGFNRPADRPVPRTDRNSQTAHEQLLEKAGKGGIDVYFLGDSITRRWGATDYPELLANWNANFFGWNAANFGWGADQIENILWRLANGELDGVDPKIIVVLAGINNVGTVPGGEAKVENITRGLQALVRTCQQKAPNAVIVLTALFPRNDNMEVIPVINAINANLARMADGKKIRYLDVNDKLADPDGRFFEGISKDKLHPGLKGYQVWADGLKPIFNEVLGPPAKTDHAPPPTGDPSARRAGPSR